MQLTETTATRVAQIGPIIVGATFIWAGIVKAIAPHSFARHLASLGWIPQKFVGSAVNVAAGLEAGLGAALVVGLAPHLVLPITLVALVVLSSISWWGVKSGKTSDCGCYGGYVQPSIGQSVGLNALFAALIAAGLYFTATDSTVALWQPIAAVAAGAGAGIFSEVAQRFERNNGRPLIDTNPIKVGGPWRHSWAHGKTAGLKGEFLVSLLGPDCPFCKQWVRVANAIVQSPSLPPVIGVIAAPPATVESFIRTYGVRFPMATVSGSLMARLTRAVPTTLIISNGVIQEIWVGSMPPEFIQRFREAFFPDVAAKVSIDNTSNVG